MGKICYKKVLPTNFSFSRAVDNKIQSQEEKVNDWRRKDQECQQYLKDEFIKSVKSVGSNNFSEVSIEITRG